MSQITNKVKQATLYQGDALSVLQTLETNYFDALITDPPYSSGGLHVGARQQSTRSKYAGKSGDHEDFLGDNKDQRSYLAWMTMWLTEANRTLKHGAPICLFTDWRQLPTVTDALQCAGFTWRGILVWDKTKGTRPVKGRFRSQAEYVIWGSKGAMIIDASADCHPGVITCAPLKGPKLHQVGKPESVMAQILKIAAEGSHILDPFAGSATTLLEAQRAGLSSTGIEMSSHYYNIGLNRLLKEAETEG